MSAARDTEDTIGMIVILSFLAGVGVFFLLSGMNVNENTSGGAAIISGVILFLTLLAKYSPPAITEGIDDDEEIED